MKSIFLSLIFVIPLGLVAQENTPRPLKIEDFEQWNTLSGGVISNNGEIIAFEQNPQQGDGMLVIRKSGLNDTIPRGKDPVVGPENDFVIFEIEQPEDTLREAEKAGIKKADFPKDSLGIRVFGREELLKFPRLESFKIPDKNARWIAFALAPPPQDKDSVPVGNNGKDKGAEVHDLVLFEVKTADTLVINHVTDYFFAKKGAAVYYIRQQSDSLATRSEIGTFNTLDGKKQTLFSAEGWARKLVSDESGEKFAFLFSSDTIPEKVWSLYYGTLASEPEKTVDRYTRGMPVGWAPSEHGKVFFSADGSKLYMGTAEIPEPAPEDSLLESEKPKVDVWNWKDLKLQSQQKKEVEKEKKRTYLAVYHTDLQRFIQLADLNIREVSVILKGNGMVGLGTNETPYLRASNWTGQWNRDYYLVDFESGIKREIVENKSYVRISPHGKYVVWYEPGDSSYYARSTDIRNLETVPLTRMIPVNFFDERNDRPMDPQPYGIAGWSEDDRFVYIYDRYDIWKIDPSGKRVPVSITKAFGRRNQMRLRYVQLDPEQEFIPGDEPSLLRAINEQTMTSGFYTIHFNEVDEPRKLVMEACHFGNIKKAQEAGILIWTREDVRTFPDLWTSNFDFSQPEKISEANPQQEHFLWPTVELVEWTSLSGEKLKGLLYKPENFDPREKYPLMVYFYERNSENLFRHQHPAPSRSIINKTFYASNGYFVFVPDITYEVGYPGRSAYNAIVSGTQYLVNTYPFIDEANMGLQGQSWGGYQTAYLVTRIDLYAAAMAGAPVSNMTSAYGGIRWGSGLSRMFQYEHTQSRIGGSLWEKPLHYLENSPLFYAPDVNTPLLMMHNDKDGAVPWYQGIEFFVALRRLNKPAWMLTYNGEPHNLKASSWANRMDLSRRMFQFFNHYLKEKPMPEWMEKGIPAVEKGETLGY